MLYHTPNNSLKPYLYICCNAYQDALKASQTSDAEKREAISKLLYFYHAATFSVRGTPNMGEMLEYAIYKLYGWKWTKRTFSRIDQLIQPSFGLQAFQERYYKENGWPTNTKLDETDDDEQWPFVC